MFVIFGRFATDVMFQSVNGDRCDVPNYLVILSDGNSDNAILTWNEAMRARARSINIISVGNSACYYSVNSKPLWAVWRTCSWYLVATLVRSTKLLYAEPG